jgi:hypothetical protein
MTHLIEDNGRFAGAVTKLLREHPAILYHDRSSEGDAIRKKRLPAKRNIRPVCGLNAWAKPEAPLVCGNCQEAMQAEEANALTR